VFYKLITGNRVITVSIILILATGLWMPVFLSPGISLTSGVESSMPLYSLLSQLFENSPIVSKLMAFLLMLVEAFLLVRINARFVLVQQRTFLPALFFIIVASHSPALMQWNPVLPATIFMILILELIFQSHQEDPNSYRFFEAGLMLGLGSLFYAPLAYMLGFIWVANMVQRPFYWREYVLPVLGLSVPFMVTFALLFLGDGSIPQFIAIIKSNFAINFNTPHNPWILWVFWIYLGLLILLASVFLVKVFQFRKIYVRNYFMVLFWLFITGSVVFLLFSGFNAGFSYVIGISISFILTNYFVNARKSILNKALLYLLLAYVVFLALANLMGIA